MLRPKFEHAAQHFIDMFSPLLPLRSKSQPTSQTFGACVCVCWSEAMLLLSLQVNSNNNNITNNNHEQKFKNNCEIWKIGGQTWWSGLGWGWEGVTMLSVVVRNEWLWSMDEHKTIRSGWVTRPPQNPHWRRLNMCAFIPALTLCSIRHFNILCLTLVALSKLTITGND